VGWGCRGGGVDVSRWQGGGKIVGLGVIEEPGTVGMQPSRKREGKSAGEGCRKSGAKAEGKPRGEGVGTIGRACGAMGGVGRLGRLCLNRSPENRRWVVGPRGDRSLSAADAAFVRGSEAAPVFIPADVPQGHGGLVAALRAAPARLRARVESKGSFLDAEVPRGRGLRWHRVPRGWNSSVFVSVLRSGEGTRAWRGTPKKR
jgi:hypothetical protein